LINNQKLSPFEAKFSINNFLENFDYGSNEQLGIFYEKVFKDVNYLIEKDTITEKIIQENRIIFEDFLSILIPRYQSNSEIKIVSLPFDNEAIFTSNLFDSQIGSVMSDNSKELVYNITNNAELYRLKCLLILNYNLDQPIKIDKKLSIKITDSNEIIRNFSLINTSEFITAKPKKGFIFPTSDQINSILDNFDDLDLWMELFPPNSWTVWGFSILSFADNTLENAITELKTNLLNSTSLDTFLDVSFKNIFRSIFNVNDLKVGITLFNPDEEQLYKSKYNNLNIDSFLLFHRDNMGIDWILNDSVFQKSFTENQVVIVQDVEIYGFGNQDSVILKSFIEQEIDSFLIAPIVSGKRFLGYIEFVSSQKYALKKRVLSRLNLILPIVVNTIKRFVDDNVNKIDAVIQTEYTSIHPSVYWKFRQQANAFLQSSKSLKDFNFKDIVFPNVFGLYGQIDIKNSSKNREEATKKDISKQLSILLELVTQAFQENKILIIEQTIFELKRFESDINENYQANTEEKFKIFLLNEVYPFLKSLRFSELVRERIEKYFELLDDKLQVVYQVRKAYDQSVMQLNRRMSSYLDENQKEAQQIFPHFYERYATDGIEHNLYIGASINPKLQFNEIYFNNLRLWQLKVLCETVHSFQTWKGNLSFPLEVATLILAFSTPLTIRFRMDEKLFDVDGAYNARYEVIKKRIDKAFVKNSEERITQADKVTIVYSQTSEKLEYMKYLKYLIAKGILEEEIELLDVEDLQGVSGLKALRVTVKP
jgi:hypothetical protein